MTQIEELALVIVSELEAGNDPGSAIECIEAILQRYFREHGDVPMEPPL